MILDDRGGRGSDRRRKAGGCALKRDSTSAQPPRDVGSVGWRGVRGVRHQQGRKAEMDHERRGRRTGRMDEGTRGVGERGCARNLPRLSLVLSVPVVPAGSSVLVVEEREIAKGDRS